MVFAISDGLQYLIRPKTSPLLQAHKERFKAMHGCNAAQQCKWSCYNSAVHVYALEWIDGRQGKASSVQNKEEFHALLALLPLSNIDAHNLLRIGPCMALWWDEVIHYHMCV
jgi:hypothetical protein